MSQDYGGRLAVAAWSLSSGASVLWRSGRGRAAKIFWLLRSLLTFLGLLPVLLCPSLFALAAYYALPVVWEHEGRIAEVLSGLVGVLFLVFAGLTARQSCGVDGVRWLWHCSWLTSLVVMSINAAATGRQLNDWLGHLGNGTKTKTEPDLGNEQHDLLYALGLLFILPLAVCLLNFATNPRAAFDLLVCLPFMLLALPAYLQWIPFGKTREKGTTENRISLS